MIASFALAKLSFQDWMALAQTFGVLVGVALAYVGLTTWRHQVRGQGAYDAARAGVKAVTALGDSLIVTRFRVAREIANPVTDYTNRGIDARSYYERIGEALSPVVAAHREVYAVLGEEVAKTFDGLERLAVLLRISIDRAMYKGTGTVDEPTSEEMSRFAIGVEGEKVDDQVRAMVATIEAALAPHLRR